MPRLGRGAIWAVGDAFSGKVQFGWLTALPGRIVIVDDGLATIRLLELLTGRMWTPLLRARARRGPAQDRARDGRRASGCVPPPAPAGCRSSRRCPFPPSWRRPYADQGAELVTHDFAWLRSQPLRRPRPEERTIVLGTSLVRNGLIHRESYFTWLAGLGSAEPVAYFPHRREDPNDLARVREQPGITVYDGGVPAEMTLRGLAAEQRVLSLPSTAVTSLRVLLSATGRRRGGRGRPRRVVDREAAPVAPFPPVDVRPSRHWSYTVEGPGRGRLGFLSEVGGLPARRDLPSGCETELA